MMKIINKSLQYKIVISNSKEAEGGVFGELEKVDYNSTVMTMTKFSNIVSGFTEKFTVKIRKHYSVVEVFHFQDDESIKWSLIVLFKGEPQVVVVSSDYLFVDEPVLVRVLIIKHDLYSISLAKYIFRNRYGLYKSFLPVIFFFSIVASVQNKNPILYTFHLVGESVHFGGLVGVISVVFWNGRVVKSEDYDFVIDLRSWFNSSVGC